MDKLMSSTVWFPKSYRVLLGELAKNERRDEMNIIKLAIVTYKTIKDELKDGGELVIIKDGVQRKIIMP